MSGKDVTAVHKYIINKTLCVITSQPNNTTTIVQFLKLSHTETSASFMVKWQIQEVIISNNGLRLENIIWYCDTVFHDYSSHFQSKPFFYTPIESRFLAY